MSKVGDSINAKSGAWTFGNGVAEKFDQHVEKSIPGYHAGHDLIIKLSDFFVGSGSTIYDIGSSTGTLLSRLEKHHSHKSNISWYGLEVEPEMVKLASQNYSKDTITFINEDSILFEFDPSDLIISYYTLQFIRPKHRQDIVSKIYNSLNWGGSLVLFEKVRAPDARFQDLATGMYTDFKLEQGFPEEEIIGKSRSIRYTMEPFSSQANVDMLKRAGFKDIMTIYKDICFEGFVAIK